MAYTTSTATPLPDNPDGARAVVLLPVPKGRTTASARSNEACRELCRHHGLSVDAVLLDQGPRNQLDRPSMRRAFSLLAREQPDAVVIYDWSQVSRYPIERRDFAQRMHAYGIKVYAVHNAGAPHVFWGSSDDRPHLVHRTG